MITDKWRWIPRPQICESSSTYLVARYLDRSLMNSVTLTWKSPLKGKSHFMLDHEWWYPFVFLLLIILHFITSLLSTASAASTSSDFITKMSISIVGCFAMCSGTSCKGLNGRSCQVSLQSGTQEINSSPMKWYITAYGRTFVQMFLLHKGKADPWSMTDHLYFLHLVKTGWVDVNFLKTNILNLCVCVLFYWAKA